MVGKSGLPPQPGFYVERILFYGNLCIDHVYDVETYPKEDTGGRALAARKSLGGNGGNSTRVLSQLRGANSCVSWLGPVPRTTDSDAVFALSLLHNSGIDTTLLEEVGGDGLPSSFVLSSRTTGSRTIVSTRNGVRELSSEHFAKAVTKACEQAPSSGAVRWCHLECRQSAEVILEFAKAWKAQAKAMSSTAKLSVEVEKPSIELEKLWPLLELCDQVFFSQEFVDKYHAVLEANEEPLAKKQKTEAEAEPEWMQHVALRCLRALSKKVAPSKAVFICTWGEHGAFAFDCGANRPYFQPAYKQSKVVDSVGAGDTFNAAWIHANLEGADVAKALDIACAVAGLKVSRVGFESLRDAIPEAAPCGFA